MGWELYDLPKVTKWNQATITKNQHSREVILMSGVRNRPKGYN